MGKNIIVLCLILILMMVSLTQADVIPESGHGYSRCVKIVNLNEYPEVSVFGIIKGPMVNGLESYRVENGKCLTKGYKFNTLSLYWVQNTMDGSVSLSDNSTIPESFMLLIENLEPYGGYVDDNNPLIEDNIEYSIAGYSSGNLVIYKSKQTLVYNNGQPNKVEFFEKPIVDNVKPADISKELDIDQKDNQKVTPEIKQIDEEKGFLDSVFCFFKRLFGGSC
jgi:hypothetical protein